MNACRRCASALFAGSLVAGSLLLVACDEEATQQLAAGRDLDRAVLLMEEAHLGFVPGEEDEQIARDVQAYRQAKLDEAIKPLEDAIDRGSTSQAVQAAVLRSDIASSHAMHLTGEAVEASNELLRETTDLFDAASSLIAQRAKLQMLDRDLGRVASRYSSARASREDEIGQLREEREQLKAELEDLQSQATDARDASRRLVLQAAEAEEKAFMAEREKRYELEDAAGESRRKAAMQTAKAEQLELRAAVVEGRLTRLERRIQALGDARDSLRQQATATDQQQSALRTQQEATRNRINQWLEELRTEATALRSTFEQDISTPLSDAADALSGTIDTLNKVMQREGLTDEQEARLRLTLFARRLDLAHVLSQHAGVTGSIASALDHVSKSSDRLDLGATVGDIEALQDRLVEATQNTAQAARDAADDIERTNAIAEIAEEAELRTSMQESLERRRRSIDRYLALATFDES